MQRPNACSARSLRSDQARAKARSLRASVPLGRYVATERSFCSVATNRASVPLGRYVATELEPKLGCYVATERTFRSLRSDRALPKHRYDN
ncbi:hypothetical protein DY000_02043094 [Brassica cretica]|uniref:Uncharacterized protein n=1 Tax=Brassica cretica TaxID=69181 RepID=A0ABQ7B594_BRACR|nr:hypothetical protein DY000_02043094 [Brassica cretica]